LDLEKEQMRAIQELPERMTVIADGKPNNNSENLTRQATTASTRSSGKTYIALPSPMPVCCQQCKLTRRKNQLQFKVSTNLKRVLSRKF